MTKDDGRVARVVSALSKSFNGGGFCYELERVRGSMPACGC